MEREVLRLRQSYKKSAPSYTYMTYKLNFHNLYRGRKFSEEEWDIEQIHDELSHVSKIWSQEPSETKKNRCNLAGDPILYLSTERVILPSECRVKSNNYLAIIEYLQQESFEPLCLLGFKKLIKYSKPLRKISQKHLDDKSYEQIYWDDKFSEIFMSDSDSKLTRDKYYNKSIAISMNIFEAHSIGIVFPSIANSLNGVNIAIKPEYAKTKIAPKSINLYKVISVNKAEYSEFILQSSGKIFSSGKISWNRINSRTIERYVF